jgi:S1-C subfamily serine protease
MVALLLATAFVIGGLLGGMAGGGLVLWATDAEISLLGTPPTPTATPAPSATPTPEPTPLLPTPTPIPLVTVTPSIADMISQVVPAVVTVVNQQVAGVRFGSTVDARILGSGIVVDQRGYIVTNYHVVEPISPSEGETGELTVILTTGEALAAYLVASDEQQDLALLHVGRTWPSCTSKMGTCRQSIGATPSRSGPGNGWWPSAVPWATSLVRSRSGWSAV